MLGGSIGLAAKRRGVAARVCGLVRREESIAECLAAGVVDDATLDAAEAVVGTDLVILCTPVGQMGELATTLKPHLAADAIVTDVGSVKGSICQAATAFANTNATFIGSHPMAGSDKAGMGHARSDLFENRPCFITPESGTQPSLIQSLSSFWQKLGMTVTTATASEHDEIVAHVSHLPHAVASAVCHLLAQRSHEWSNFLGRQHAGRSSISFNNTTGRAVVYTA
mgnify:CR=1 FL=1